MLCLLFLINSARSLFILVDFSKNQVLDLLHLSNIHLFSVLFTLDFMFIIFFLLLLDLFCLFIMSIVGSVACNVKLSLFSNVSTYGSKFSKDTVFVLSCPNLFCVIFFLTYTPCDERSWFIWSLSFEMNWGMKWLGNT